MSKQLFYVATSVFMVIALSACGSKGPAPTSELALAVSALESAELSGAREHAPIELRLAREKKAAAEKAMAAENYNKARYLTVEARVDAELARAVSDAEKSQLELNRAQENIDRMQGNVLPAGNTQ